jgi:glycine/D-amino acid oxidase-like deaminating enzyme/nitrite reductase/ring-hydroxylating ferredoxin subunit
MNPSSQQSLWEKTAQAPTFEQLSGDMEVDVAIIGGGITGLTAAYLLQKAGQKVVVIEAARIGMGVTGYTTAHLTEQLDIFFTDLIKRFGKKKATIIAQTSRAAIDQIATNIRDLQIEADFTHVPGYLYSEDQDDRQFLQAEALAAQELGIKAEFVKAVPLPFPTVGAVKFPAQGQFHPLKYIYGLANFVQQNGGHIFEQTRVQNIKGRKVITPQGVVRAKKIVMGTHTPILTRLLSVQGKLSPKRSYVLGAKLEGGQRIEPGLYWETKRPYHYMRSWGEGDDHVLVVGGEDHPTGIAADTRPSFDRLKRYARKKFSVASVDSQWSAQYFNAADDVPYIGKAPLTPHVYVATGFSGTGLTFGTASAMLISDLILGRENVWAKVYKPSRLSLAALRQLVVFGINNVRHVLLDRLKSARAGSPDDLASGEGRLMRYQGKNMAVYKDDQGKVTKLSPICTHAGCVVQFNSAEKTWDCPCHGSRFSGEGKVLVGPAVEDLTSI